MKKILANSSLNERYDCYVDEEKEKIVIRDRKDVAIENDEIDNRFDILDL